MRRILQCKKTIVTLSLIFSVLSVAIFPSVTQAIGLGDIFKVGGVGFVVDRIAKPLNNFINSLMAKQGAATDYATKVVPIISVGSSGHIGAAQVTGDQDLVDRTKAVLQIEGDFSGLRVKALVPIDSENPLNFSRVNGVGVSAVVDIRI
ncbi:MAG TPA: hypothetical protein PKA28_06020 [Methylomusa anaerophila]|uniref:Uncharacterized protein n=1 Tax=Methylomusa anaerophila TaxID=1930071 RepID=A0A348ALQ0_9FIRM|nr:hypothetical protein [Methylomusa anaerophila]BBB91998.1 hypothetical protein MAMMFC1_02683 [Methylomusa anaerophila]HML87989.1 hypothetical protein [Methylomusa anaerophila]